MRCWACLPGHNTRRRRSRWIAKSRWHIEMTLGMAGSSLSSDRDRRCCVLEIKTKVFADEDLHNQRAYSESSEVSPGAERVFIAVDAEGFDLRGFRSLSWSEVCIRLRCLAPTFAANRGHLAAALLLAFVGAVEQNLLGLAESSGRDLGALPKTAEHLKRFLESTQRADSLCRNVCESRTALPTLQAHS